MKKRHILATVLLLMEIATQNVVMSMDNRSKTESAAEQSDHSITGLRGIDPQEQDFSADSDVTDNSSWSQSPWLLGSLGFAAVGGLAYYNFRQQPNQGSKVPTNQENDELEIQAPELCLQDQITQHADGNHSEKIPAMKPIYQSKIDIPSTHYDLAEKAVS